MEANNEGKQEEEIMQSLPELVGQGFLEVHHGEGYNGSNNNHKESGESRIVFPQQVEVALIGPAQDMKERMDKRIKGNVGPRKAVQFVSILYHIHGQWSSIEEANSGLAFGQED